MFMASAKEAVLFLIQIYLITLHFYEEQIPTDVIISITFGHSRQTRQRA